MKQKKVWSAQSWLSLLMIVLMLTLAACSGNNDKTTGGASAEPSPTASTQPQETEATAEETVYPLTIVDVTGTELVFDKAPTAVVSIAPSETESIFAIGGGETVVGVDSNSNYPEEVKGLPQVGDYITNIEAVAALNPDLVLAASMNGDAITKLRELDIPVYVTDPKSYEEVVAKLEDLGKIMNMNTAAAEAADKMRSTLAQVTNAVKDAEKKKVYLEISPGWTVGSGEFLDAMITLAGGTNVAASQPGWFEVNVEEVITQNPQIIIYPEYGEGSPAEADIVARPGWSELDAVKNDAIIAVANDPLVRVGPRLADSLLELAKAIHPELIK
ncbi:ABC transporter substrate-binding protein [Paenibacillus sp. MY03]|uniref:ABC transporter substrate-binding protein n=1 Tax=Paenibacillus sp. MY03 TaxID=302980 RepID=UPI00211B338A|nr:ABC transporter substrate-binding protein [Paenibacillus sp. MY03]